MADDAPKVVMKGGDQLDPVFRDIFVIHATLSEIVIEFGTIDKNVSEDGPQTIYGTARNRIVIPLAKALQLAEALSFSVERVREEMTLIMSK